MDAFDSRGTAGEPSSPFAISVQELTEARVMRMAGELDMIAVDEVSGALNSALGSSLPVIADCAAVTFSSSAILGLFYAAHTRAMKTGSRFVLVANGHAMLRPLAALGLLDVMTVVPDVVAALRELELWELESPLSGPGR